MRPFFKKMEYPVTETWIIGESDALKDTKATCVTIPNDISKAMVEIKPLEQVSPSVHVVIVANNVQNCSPISVAFRRCSFSHFYVECPLIHEEIEHGLLWCKYLCHSSDQYYVSYDRFANIGNLPDNFEFCEISLLSE